MNQGAAALAAACENGEILMQCTYRWMFLGLLLSAPVLIAQTVPDPAATPNADAATAPPHDTPKVQKQAVLPPMPSGPLSQMPMDQIPPTPAKVKFQGGLLEISAQNSTLGEILRDVRKLTGASIEFPPGSSGMNERVVTHLGPGAPRDVLDVLLNGSSFNYVMVGSSSDPGAVSSVILTAKPSASGETQTAANAHQNNAVPMLPNGIPPRAFNQSGPHIGMPGPPQPSSADGDDSKDEDQGNTAEDNADDQTQPAQPAEPDTTDANTQAEQQPDPNQPNAGPRTPEQILEMLRKQQQPGGAIPPTVVPPAPQPPQQQ